MDNTTITPGTGVTVAADDVGGVLHQRVKPTWGPDGTANDVDIASGKALPVQVRSATGLIPIGEPTDAAATQTDTTSVSIISILKQTSKSIQLFVFGSGTAAAALRVTHASDDPAVTAIGSTNTKLDTLHADLATTLAGYVDGLETLNGPVTETAPATDTASSGLNGRLQRIAQRVTALITLLPASIGGKTAAASLGVTLASDDPAVATLGAKTDAKSTATDATSVSMVSILKQISASCQAFVFGAGTAAAAERVTLASDDPAVSVLGATSGAAVITDANGTVQQYLRGVVKLLITSGTIVLGALPAGTALIGKVKTKFIVAAASAYTRPANTTAYTANDQVANNATPGSVTAISLSLSDVNDDMVTLERIRILSTDTGVQGKNFRVWLFNSDPTANSGVQGGDNVAWSQKQAGFIGSMSGTFRAFLDGAGAVCVPDEGTRIITAPVSGAKTVFALLQTLDAFTPSANSTTFTLTAEGFQGAA